MNIKFRQGSEELSDRLIERAQAKIAKLSKFIDERNYEALVYVDITRESGATNSESLWRASINFDLAGDRYNAVGTGNTPEKATDLAIKDLKREVRKAKGKHMSIVRRGYEALKQLRRDDTDFAI